jgi:hypothetical protein
MTLCLKERLRVRSPLRLLFFTVTQTVRFWLTNSRRPFEPKNVNGRRVSCECDRARTLLRPGAGLKAVTAAERAVDTKNQTTSRKRGPSAVGMRSDAIEFMNSDDEGSNDNGRTGEDNECLFRIVGEAMVRVAWEDEAFRLKLKRALEVIVTDERSLAFLRAEGMI